MYTPRVSLISVLCLFLVAANSALAQEPDFDGAKDHPMLTRMPNYYILNYEELEYNSHDFYVGYDVTPVEGRHYYYLYVLQPNATAASPLQVLRNYENAVTAIGGEVLTSNYDGISCMKVVGEGKEVWVMVSANIAGEYHVNIVEKEAMIQDVVGTLEMYTKGLATEGHVAVYDILFDTGKSDIKAESAVAIGEIAVLLTTDPALRLHIVGHTDNVGSMDSNMALSQARAEAVMRELVSTHNIDSGRLKAWGVSSLAPVSTNDTDEGRVKNRRVELVKA